MIFNWNNISFQEINELLSNEDKLGRDNIIEINLEKKGKFYGYVDQAFLGYSILLLRKYPTLQITINFKDSVKSDRYFSFSDQVNQAKHLYKNTINDSNFVLLGTYALISTGVVYDLSNYVSITQSSSFIPPILIFKRRKNDADESLRIKKFFLDSVNTNNKLIAAYTSKLKSEFDSFIPENESGLSTRQKKFVEKFYQGFQNYSFIKVCILRILIEEDTMTLFKRKRNLENIDILISLEKFCDDLISGLIELAKNIYDHSESDGVITVRKFKKEILRKLKSNEENDYLNSSNQFNDLLDIKVIDLGTTNIKEKYVTNLKQTHGAFEEYVKSDIKEDQRVYVFNALNISFQEDINIISSADFKFYKLFVRDKNHGINELSIQNNKFISKIGIQYFTSIIKDNYSGFIRVSSGRERALFYNENGILKHSIKNSETFIKHGTIYSCIVPILNWFRETKESDLEEEKRYNQDENTFIELSDYNFIESNEQILQKYKKDKKNIINFEALNQLKQSTRNEEVKYMPFFALFVALQNIQNEGNIKFFPKSDIIAISCKELQTSEITNASHWVRFIWVFTYFFENIILYDIDLKNFFSIVNLRKTLSSSRYSELDFWEDSSRVLFYSKKEKLDSEYYRYGVNILAGESIEEFNYLNKRIWNHHYSIKLDLPKLTAHQTNKFKNSNHLKSVLFTESKNLHYYEVLLHTSTPNEDRISLFEKSIQYSLNTSLKDKQNSPTNNKGYKIEKTHFRLGSKIHISEFYYAKKLFQNSFFTTPLAYSISENIFNTCLKENNNPLSFTIVGYEGYSSFLISTIRNFLMKRIGDRLPIKINHTTIDKDAKLSIHQSKVFQNVMIVVPIASSFNTSLKIEDQLNEYFTKDHRGNVKVIQPTQNSVLVAHREKKEVVFESFFDSNGNLIHDASTKNIYQKYNWSHVDKSNKIVTLERYNFQLSNESNGDNKRQQKYLVPVYTTWNEAKDCVLCYPEDEPTHERCLIETGKASITPQVIFDYPKTKKAHSVLETETPQLNLEGSLLFGSLKKRDNRYLFYTRTDKVVENNERKIITWIKSLKNKVFKGILSNQKVVIVTPTTGSKSRFLDIVNEYLFEYTANCIIISLKEDYIENAETLYSDGLHDADIVVYVDDVLSTANSFLEVNFIVKYIRKKSDTKQGIDYCISLINRMSFENEENLLLKLLDLNKEEEDNPQNRLLYLQKIYHPTIEEANNKFPLVLESKRYEKLEINSSLDQIRDYFHVKRKNLKPKNLSKSFTNKVKDYSLDFNRGDKRRNKKLYQFLVLSAMYSIFEMDRDTDLAVRTSYLDKFFPRVRLDDDKDGEIIKSLELLHDEISNRLKKDKQHQLLINDNEKNLDYVIIKLICSTPLIYYEQIRLAAFNWILLKLENLQSIISKLKSPLELFELNKGSHYSYYQDLKFLLKKSVKVRSNYIIHPKTLNFLKITIEKISKITDEDLSLVETCNQKFKEALEVMATNNDFLENPVIKLQLYDIIQNNLKGKIFDSLLFDKYSIKSNGLSNGTESLTPQDEKSYHKNLLSKNKTYHLKKEDEVIGNDIEIVKKQDEKLWKQFVIERTKLLRKPRYKVSTTKRLIVHLVALVQELVYEHEVKSFELDNVIKPLRIEANDNENGTFEHFLRLLHLENIEIINSYSLELLEKHQSVLDRVKINEYNFRNQVEPLRLGYIEGATINDILASQKKYEELCDFQDMDIQSDTSSIDNFIALKKYLLDSVKTEGKEDKIEIKAQIINEKIKQIIDPTGKIVEDIFFTIHYKDFENYRPEDTYTFSLNFRKTKKITAIESENSLTSAMGNEKFKTEDEHLFSHIEIIKKNGNLECRDDQNIKKMIEGSDQYKCLDNNKYLLLIRISDFNDKKVGNTNDNKFITRGVLSIYLNQVERLNEKKLRLLLALRQGLLGFIKRKTQGSTFLELLKIKEKDDYFDSLKHSFERYFINQTNIKNGFLQQLPESKRILEESKSFDLITETLKLQTYGFSRKNILDKVELDQESIEEHIKSIFSSITIGSQGFTLKSKNINYQNLKGCRSHLVFPRIIPYTVILNLITNVKQYTIPTVSNYKVSIINSANSWEIKITNVIDYGALNSKRSGFGNQMCHSIIDSINSHPELSERLGIAKITLHSESVDNSPNPNEYIAELKIYYHEK